MILDTAAPSDKPRIISGGPALTVAMIEHPGVGKRNDSIEAEPARIRARRSTQAARIPARPRIQLPMNRHRCTKDSITKDGLIGARLYRGCMKIDLERHNPPQIARKGLFLITKEFWSG